MKMSMGQTGRRLLGLAVAGVALAASGTAFAELGQPAPWEYKLQEAATPVMEMPVMIPMNACLLFARKYRVAMKSSKRMVSYEL